MLSKEERVKWFMDARFGMFIHWGIYSIPARGEWIRSHEKITIEAYQKYFEEFNPTNYDPQGWAKVSKDAGMKYAVMTSKHHDGFCLFNSKLTDYKSTNTTANRDLIEEYVESFRNEGLKVGFYYSLLDWHHEHYPIYTDRHHPMRANEMFKDKHIDFNKYVEYLHGQVKELLTNYGKIDIIWFDFSYDDMTGEKWSATKLVNMVRELQPDTIIDIRLGGNLRIKTPEIYAGDFITPERVIPPECILNEDGQPIPWESCITLNDHWGYCANDMDYKTPKQIIRTIVECVSKNGNLLLNGGPNAKGEITEPSLNVLSEVGKWMKKNGESIYGCGMSKFPKPEWGRFTQNGNNLYAHVLDTDSITNLLNFWKFDGKIKSARLLADGSELKVGGVKQFYSQYLGGLSIKLPNSKHLDDVDTVIKLELK